MTDLPTEIVWCNANAGIDYFLALPRPDFDDKMALLAAWQSGDWGTLSETASPEHYDYISSMFGFDPSDPSSDDDSFDTDTLEDGSSLAGWILALMYETLPLELFAFDEEIGTSVLDGYMVEIPAERTNVVLRNLVDAGITVTRDDRLVDMYTESGVAHVIDPPEGWDQIQVSS